jgi:hypothetical protein
MKANQKSNLDRKRVTGLGILDIERAGHDVDFVQY